MDLFSTATFDWLHECTISVTAVSNLFSRLCLIFWTIVLICYAIIINNNHKGSPVKSNPQPLTHFCCAFFYGQRSTSILSQKQLLPKTWVMCVCVHASLIIHKMLHSLSLLSPISNPTTKQHQQLTFFIP